MRPLKMRNIAILRVAGLRLSGLDDLRLLAARHSGMLRNAAALSAGACATAVLGFAYWWFAARSFPAEAVGFAAAAISMMNFLALVSELGMGTLLMGEVPKMPDTAPSLISASLLSSLVAGLLVGLIYLVTARWMSIDLGGITATGATKAVFLFGLTVTGFTLVLDQAFVGMLRSTLQMYRTISFATVKLVLLGIAGLIGTPSEFGIFGTWIGGQLCSIVLLSAFCAHGGNRIWYTPKVRLLRPLLGTVLRHHLLSIVIQAPGLILPFVVAVALSPRTNAAFYAAWTLVNVMLLVPASLTSVLYSIGAREPLQLPHRLKVSLGISTLVGLSAGIGLFLSSEFIMGLFNPAYPVIAGASLKLLGFGTLGVMLKYHYVVVQRLRYRMLEASMLLGAAGALEIFAAIVGARSGGLFGLTEGWLFAVFAEAIILSPVVVRAALDGIPSEAAGLTPPPKGAMPVPAVHVATQQSQSILSCEPTQ
jgi:O-antigen/teichoic acid export membrane protein